MRLQRYALHLMGDREGERMGEDGRGGRGGGEMADEREVKGNVREVIVSGRENG